MKQIAIVGAGIAGLAAAQRLRRPSPRFIAVDMRSSRRRRESLFSGTTKSVLVLAAIGVWDRALKRRSTAAKHLLKPFSRHRGPILSSENPTLTVYFDGSCPLCRAEIAHYRKQDGASQLNFRDVSQTDQPLEPDLARESAMLRFHVRRSDGQLVSGGAAFVSIWSQLPRWRWAARIAELPGVMTLLEGGYRLFLPARPTLAWAFRKIQASKQKHHPVENRDAA